MKHIMIILIALIIGCISCEKIDYQEENTSSKQSLLKIYICESDAEDKQSPLYVYVFNSDGACCKMDTVFETKEMLTMNLAPALYHVVVLTGCKTDMLPNNPNLNSTIDFLPSTSDSLRVGQASVTVLPKGNMAYVHMNYAVAKLKVKLTGIPEDVRRIGMTISSLYTKWSFAGKGELPSTVEFDLIQSPIHQIWESPDYYLLPTEGLAALTIHLHTAKEVQSFSFTASDGLQASKSYVFEGVYAHTGMLQISSPILGVGWQEETHWLHDLSREQTADSLPRHPLPESRNFWGNHMVVHVEESSDSTLRIYLLSREEKENVPSAWNVEYGDDEALKYAREYKEGEMGGWHIPTKEEAQMLQRTLQGKKLMQVNDLLIQRGYVPFLDYEPNSVTEKARYLCDDAMKAFSVVGMTAPSKAGEKKLYRLRLVKTMEIEKE